MTTLLDLLCATIPYSPPLNLYSLLIALKVNHYNQDITELVTKISHLPITEYRSQSIFETIEHQTTIPSPSLLLRYLHLFTQFIRIQYGFEPNKVHIPEESIRLLMFDTREIALLVISIESPPQLKSGVRMKIRRIAWSMVAMHCLTWVCCDGDVKGYKSRRVWISTCVTFILSV